MSSVLAVIRLKAKMYYFTVLEFNQFIATFMAFF